jgi:hypothetical protein
LRIGSPYSWGWTGTTLDVSGTDRNTVFGVFHELEQELESHRGATDLYGADLTFGRSIVRVLIAFLIGFLVAQSIVVVQVKLVGRLWPRVAQADLQAAVLMVAWIIAAICTGIFLGQCFGPVQFTGALSDPGAQTRYIATFVLLALLVPLAMNIIGSKLVGPTQTADGPKGGSET